MNAAEEASEGLGVVAACEALGVARGSFYRRRRCAETPATEPAPRPSPDRAMPPAERQELLDTIHQERFVDMAPPQIYAKLLDEGVYFCHWRTMYRVLHSVGEVRERRDQREHPRHAIPRLRATGPNTVWSWDITKLAGPCKGVFYQLYVVIDLYSRYVVGWLLATKECQYLAEKLLKETYEKQGVEPGQLSVHSDRGPSMTSGTVVDLLVTLEVSKTVGRPRVSNDNAFSESLFKTAKYRPEFPRRFGSFDEAHAFCRRFFAWYHDEHFHSALHLLKPSDVHHGRAPEVLASRHEVRMAAYRRHPERFVKGPPALPTLPAAVWINRPEEQDTCLPVVPTIVPEPRPEEVLVGAH